MLLSDLSTRKDNVVEDELNIDATNNEKEIFPCRKKKQKRDHGIVQWTEADLKRLMDIMEDYSCELNISSTFFYANYAAAVAHIVIVPGYF